MANIEKELAIHKMLCYNFVVKLHAYGSLTRCQKVTWSVGKMKYAEENNQMEV